MDTFFYILLAFLALLAATDLFVGVSNDAVNFLNSAVGCRIAPFKWILIVAGIGVLLGATFSGGMMEIARKGIFHPAMFTFAEVITIYFAVMVTDVMLLNAFNGMGLPTSTTVSIVFELLGASAGIAGMKLLDRGVSLEHVTEFLNSSKSLEMISAILVSVVVAFICGAIVQYITRVIFTFHYEKMFRKIGGIYGGFAIAMIFYFLVMKGAKGASFMTPEAIAFLTENSLAIVAGIFVVCSAVLHILMVKWNFNIFRLVILAGTFALAFSFAGNDLVNFVGVPIAALNSASIFLGAGGADPENFMMAGLAEDIAPPTLLLLLSGIIMVVTLFTSKSARAVIETSLNLSSSSGDKEQFGATLPGRLIVRGGLRAGKILSAIIPNRAQNYLDSRFTPIALKYGEEPLPFDYIRASLNLIIAAILIATATSLKLPLSTTYVTFMVAMGSSFADRAWDRESAVYRVSGVVTVICGWFLTAFTAFTAACIVGSLISIGGRPLCVVLLIIVVAVIVKTNIFPNKEKQSALAHIRLTDRDGVKTMLDREIPRTFSTASQLYSEMIEAYLADNEKELKRILNRASEVFDETTSARALYYQMAKKVGDHDDNDVKHLYYRSFTGMRETARTLVRTATLTKEHVANRHRILEGELAENLRILARELEGARADVNAFCSPEGCDIDRILKRSKRMQEMVDRCQYGVLTNSGQYKNLSLRTSELYLVIVQFVREVTNRYSMVITLQQRLNQICEEGQEAAKP